MFRLNFTILIIWLWVISAIGDVINVPADQATIQSAINTAVNGDTVMVAEGTYYENINYNGKAITVSSLFLMDGDTSHISKTIIDGSKPSNPDSGSVVFIISGEDTNSVLCGFTITGGSGTKFVWGDIKVTLGGGVLIDSSGAKIINNKICANIIDDKDRYCYSGGIEAFSLPGMDIIIESNEICHNEVYADWGGGGGADLSPHGYLLFKNNHVHHNLFDSKRAGHGGGIVSMGSKSGLKGKINMINNRIMHNEAKGQGSDSWGGGYYSEFPNLYMSNNIIAENKANYGGGFCILTLTGWADVARARMVNNTIVNNNASIAGAIWNRQSDVIVLNSILWNPAANNEIDGRQAVNVDIHHSDVRGGWAGTQNFSSHPKFSESSYHLSDASRCIGAGTSSMTVDDILLEAPVTDLDGHIRPDPAGSNPDLGALENERSYPEWETVRQVPQEFKTIQDAINAAEDGDTVLVDAGLYYENINFKGKAITVSSLFLMDGDTSHISKTIIDGSKPTNPDSGSTVLFDSGEDTTSVLCGFTITGGIGTNFIYDDLLVNAGGGIGVFNSGAKIIHNYVTKNIINEPSRYCYGGGISIWCELNLPSIIKENEISHNSVFADWGGGGGVEMGINGYGLFKDNHVHHNLFKGQRAGHGGGFLSLGAADDFNNGNIEVLNNLIIHNEVVNVNNYSYGGGVYTEFPDLLLVNNIIAQNSSGYGAGIYVSTWSNWPLVAKLLLINNTITKNSANVRGAAVYNRESEIIIINSIIFDNQGNQQISLKNAKKMEIAFSNVEGSWPGGSNIDMDPQFVHVNIHGDTTYYCLEPSSPCIDTGPDSAFFNDIENTVRPGKPLWPALGTLRNDMGAYGGQEAYDMEKLPDMIDWVLDVPKDEVEIPFTYGLSQNYPNPFNPSTNISFNIPKPEQVTIEVYNTLGQRIATALHKKMSAGAHQIKFNGRSLPSGVYFYKLIAGEFQQVRKMVLLK